MAFLDSSFIAGVIMNLLIVILLIAIYTYIVNLENKGCKCADNGDSKFIKGFSIFAIIYLLATMFIPHKILVNTLGPIGSNILSFINIIFVFVSIYFWYITFRYTRYLVNEKCKCSEDIRREIIMTGSVLELILIFFIFILGLLFAIIFTVIMTTFNYIDSHESELQQIVQNPLKSINKLPSKFKSSMADVSKIVKGTSSSVKRLVNKNTLKK